MDNLKTWINHTWQDESDANRRILFEILVSLQGYSKKPTSSDIISKLMSIVQNTDAPKSMSPEQEKLFAIQVSYEQLKDAILTRFIEILKNRGALIIEKIQYDVRNYVLKKYYSNCAWDRSALKEFILEKLSNDDVEQMTFSIMKITNNPSRTPKFYSRLVDVLDDILRLIHDYGKENVRGGLIKVAKYGWDTCPFSYIEKCVKTVAGSPEGVVHNDNGSCSICGKHIEPEDSNCPGCRRKVV